MSPTAHSTGRALHYKSAGLVLLTTLVAFAAVHGFVQWQIERNLEQFNVYPLPLKLSGVALERQVFQNSDVLPIYGSSELTEDQANRADAFFAGHPTGFGAFLIGNPGETSLIIATKLAAAGDAAAGRKAVVFLSPGWFVVPELDPRGFGVNFSALQGGIFAFESRLSPALKQAVARRLLDYPATISQNPLLDRALKRLEDDSQVARLRLTALLPLGMLTDRLQVEINYAKLGMWLCKHRRAIPAVPVTPAAIDWNARLREADAACSRQPALTAYSTGPRTWFDDVRQKYFRDPAHPGASPDENFERDCLGSREWEDLQLLLRTAREMRVRLLVICQPINEGFQPLQGLTARSSALFYGRLQRAFADHDVPLVTLPEEGRDRCFYRDCIHPTAKAWLIYDRLLDAFYHQPDPPVKNS